MPGEVESATWLVAGEFAATAGRDERTAGETSCYYWRTLAESHLTKRGSGRRARANSCTVASGGRAEAVGAAKSILAGKGV
jgi:hypothetical protein